MKHPQQNEKHISSIADLKAIFDYVNVNET